MLTASSSVRDSGAKGFGTWSKFPGETATLCRLMPEFGIRDAKF